MSKATAQIQRRTRERAATKTTTLAEQLNRDIKAARENLAYWTCHKAVAIQQQTKVDAGARVLLWQSQLKSLLAKQAAFYARA